MRNHDSLDPQRWHTFVESLAELGIAFTEFQFVKIAASSGLLPVNTPHIFNRGSNPLPSVLPEIGEFGRVGYHNNRIADWEPLGVSRYAQHMVRTRLLSAKLVFTVTSSRACLPCLRNLGLRLCV